MIHKYCFFNGRIISAKDAKVSVNDLGVLRGYAVFDFLRTYNGKPFELKFHYDRFKKSAKKLDLDVPVSVNDLEKILFSLLKKNKVEDASFRMIITGGPTLDSMSFVKPNFYILTEEVYQPTVLMIEKGVKIITHDYMRYLPESKTTHYMEAVRMSKERLKQGAFEVLYTSKGKAYECTTSNIFVIKNGVLITPDEDILLGVTRKLVLELARSFMKVEERNIKVDDLKKADEVFLTGTNKKILPIVKIDNFTVGDGKPGQYTKELLRLFIARTDKN